MAECIRDRIQENCAILSNKKMTPTRLVGFLCHLERNRNQKNSWQGSMVVRYNNNNLDKNPLRYNFSNVIEYRPVGSYRKSMHYSFTSRTTTEQQWYEWITLNKVIKEHRKKGIYDFLVAPLQVYSWSINEMHWPNLNYDELFTLIENNENRRTSFEWGWVDETQNEIDGKMHLHFADELRAAR